MLLYTSADFDLCPNANHLIYSISLCRCICLWSVCNRHLRQRRSAYHRKSGSSLPVCLPAQLHCPRLPGHGTLCQPIRCLYWWPRWHHESQKDVPLQRGCTESVYSSLPGSEWLCLMHRDQQKRSATSLSPHWLVSPTEKWFSFSDVCHVLCRIQKRSSDWPPPQSLTGQSGCANRHQQSGRVPKPLEWCDCRTSHRGSYCCLSGQFVFSCSSTLSIIIQWLFQWFIVCSVFFHFFFLVIELHRKH